MAETTSAPVRFRVRQAYASIARDQAAISIGNEGWMIQDSGDGWGYVVLDPPSEMEGWAPIQYLELSDVRRGHPVRVHLATDSLALTIPKYTFMASSDSKIQKVLTTLALYLKQTLGRTNQLDFLKAEVKAFLQSEAAIRDFVQFILDTMPSRVKQILNSGNFTATDFETCKPVGTLPKVGVYCRVYFMHSGRAYFYIGSSVGMWARQSEHNDATLSTDRVWDTPHYRVAREAKSYFAFLIAETGSLEEWKLRFIEQIFILLWACYADSIVVPPKASIDEEVTDWTVNSWHAYALNNIAIRAFKDAQWATVTESTHSGGCNVQSPSANDNDIDRVIWIRMTNREGTVMTLRRRPSKITVDTSKGAITGTVHLFGTTHIAVPAHALKSIDTNLPVNLVFEVRLDRRPHDAPYCRLPLVGGYSDWFEASSLGLRMEYRTPAGWRAVYLQRKNMWRSTDIGAPRAYAEASAFLAAFNNMVYSDLSPWRLQITALKIVDVSFNHHSQVIDVREKTGREERAEPSKKSTQQVTSELEGMGFRVGRSAPTDTAWRLQNNGKGRSTCDHCTTVSLLEPSSKT
ncbi:MAG: hypothetical protein Q9183_002648 [Haloplaca sp. 2 TL-2023]